MEQTIKTIAKHLYARGKGHHAYVRRRIPAAIRAAYPESQSHITTCLGTSDVKEAEILGRVELARIDAEFAQKSQAFDLTKLSLWPKRIKKLTADQLEEAGKFWIRQVLLNDDELRERGLDDDEFEDLGERLESQRAELGRMLAQGKALKIFPALHGFLYLCGLDFEPDQEEMKRASFGFLRVVVRCIDHQLARHRGDTVETKEVVPAAIHPLYVVVPARAPADSSRPDWDFVFATWRDYVKERPKSTTIASQTPWRDLRAFAESRGLASPVDVTPERMTAFVQAMHERGLAVDTINERIGKVRAIYHIAAGRHVLASNPAASTLGYKENGARKRRARRLPFDKSDLALIFGSELYAAHKRSRGQSGEASYWIPVLMYYTGARPEELAGLALTDLVEDGQLGWYLKIVDRPCGNDLDLFDEAEIPESHRRTLKNAASTRNIPVAKQLIELGLLRYVDWLRASGSAVLFPTLHKDWHEKLSGSFSKFFGRYKRFIGISDGRKVLYSFRHSMKDFLESAAYPASI